MIGASIWLEALMILKGYWGWWGILAGLFATGYFMTIPLASCVMFFHKAPIAAIAYLIAFAIIAGTRMMGIWMKDNLSGKLV
jgi:hypothetical protein